MSTRTTYYNLTKPDADEHVLRTVINQNYDAIDLQMHANAQAAKEAAGNVTSEYNPSTTYNEGDLCIFQNKLYSASATTTGTFDPSCWDETTIETEFKRNGRWRLFETITADGNSQRVESILPTNCTGVIMKYHLTASATDSAGFHSVKFLNESGRVSFDYLSAIVTSADRYGEARIIADGNFWQAEFTSAAANNNSTLTEYIRQNAFIITDNKLENIRFDTTGSPAVNIPAGSTFDIYVRT